jgi:formiminoglutamate deiminase
VSPVYWCELAWLAAERAEPGLVIEVEGDRIASLTRGVGTPPGGAERLAGVTLPGFANSHSHAFQRALRGRTQGGQGSFWTWREQMYSSLAGLDPDGYLALARAAFAEMALAGITLVGEFHYLHRGPGGAPYLDGNAMGDAVIQAAWEAGIRITLLDTCYLHGGIGKPPDEAQQRFADRDADAWVKRVDALQPGPHARVGAAIHSVRAVDPDSARVVAEWAASRSTPLHAHVSEQVAENEECFAAYGATPTQILSEAGALSERFTAVHATHVSDADVALLGGAEAFCCLCPTTERDLADGIGPARRVREAGARLTLGSDSHAVIDMLEEARAVELDERLASGVRGQHRAPDLLRAAAEAGYAGLGWPEGGRIEEGALADLTVVGLDSVRLAGTPVRHALESVVFAGAAPDVQQVMVGGEWIVRDGAHMKLDVPAELAAVLAE